MNAFVQRHQSGIQGSGIGKYIFATGSGIQSYMHFGEIVAIIAGGYGIPSSRSRKPCSVPCGASILRPTTRPMV